LVAAAGFGAAIFVTTPGLLGTIRNLFLYFGSDSSIAYRTADYDVATRFLEEHPFFGRGAGTYLPTFLGGRYNPTGVFDNQYLKSLVEIGLVGLVIMAAYLLTTAFLGRGVRHRAKDPATRDLGQAFAATSLACAATALTFDAFSFLMFAGLIPLCLGVVGALWAVVRGEADSPPNRTGVHANARLSCTKR